MVVVTSFKACQVKANESIKSPNEHKKFTELKIDFVDNEILFLPNSHENLYLSKQPLLASFKRISTRAELPKVCHLNKSSKRWHLYNPID